MATRLMLGRPALKAVMPMLTAMDLSHSEATAHLFRIALEMMGAPDL